MTTQNKELKPLPPSPDQYNKSDNSQKNREILALDHNSIDKNKPVNECWSQTNTSKNKGN